jgi:PhnB protein
MLVQPYLNYDGKCEEAIKFYQGAVGAEVIMLMRFKDSPEPPPPSAGPAPSPEKVLHAAFKIGDSTVLASDGHCQGRESFKGFSLSLTVPDEAGADRAFRSLSQGGQVTLPLTKTFFSPKFGMLTDRFGLGWMVYVTPSKP